MVGPAKGTWRDHAWLWGGLAALLAVALYVAHQNAAELLVPGVSDAYLKQALAWRDGRSSLAVNYEWLELAIYQGHYYVSFPPVPTVPIWLLTFVFGANVPSGCLPLVYLLLGYLVLCRLLRRYLPAWQAVLMALFVCLGGSLLDVAISGGIFTGGSWFQAQMLAFLLTALAFWLVDGEGRLRWGLGLVCIALAVGCRPFNAVYVPVLLWMLGRKLYKDALWPTLVAMLPYVAVPLLIAGAYAAYNYARFDHPLEFGHSYLPELAQAGEGMFLLSRILPNLKLILRPPYLQDGQLYFPNLCGYGVYFTNPMLLFAPQRGIARAIGRQADVTDAILGVTLLVHAALLLMHRTNGGWQYGTRYLCDLLPALAFLYARGGKGPGRVAIACMALLVVFNVYATIVFHRL